MDKLGSYITNLMLTVRDSEEKHFLRKLALDDLIKLPRIKLINYSK